MRLRRVTDVEAAACDMAFLDEETLVAVDQDADVWTLGLDGTQAHIGDGREVRAALGDLRAAQASGALPPVPVPDAITWHPGSATLVITIDHSGWWSLVARIGAGPWRQVLTGSAIVSSPVTTWAPEGRQLAVNVDGAAIVDLSGSRSERFAGAGAWGWMPDGQLLMWYLDAVESPWRFGLVDPVTGQERSIGAPPYDMNTWGFAMELVVAADGDTCLVVFPRWLVWYSLRTLEVLSSVDSGAPILDVRTTADRSTVVLEHESSARRRGSWVKGGVRLWDLATMQPLTDPEPTIASAAPAPSGRRYVCRSVGASGWTCDAADWSVWELA